MALGGFRGHLWFVLGAPDGLLRVVLASVKPISTIKTALPSFDIIFSLAVVAVLVVPSYLATSPRLGSAECADRLNPPVFLLLMELGMEMET